MTLTCGAEGTPEPNITWYKDGVLLRGENSRNLVIQEVQLSDRGWYHCNATNFDPNEQDEKFEEESVEAVINIKGEYNLSWIEMRVLENVLVQELHSIVLS